MPPKMKIKHNISGLCNQPKATPADVRAESQQPSNVAEPSDNEMDDDDDKWDTPQA